MDLVLTFSFTDVDVEGMFEPLLLLVDVFSFLALFLLRTLFLPIMREETLLLWYTCEDDADMLLCKDCIAQGIQKCCCGDEGPQQQTDALKPSALRACLP